MPEPKIECLFGELKLTSEITEHPKNPNQHPGDQIEKLAKVIALNGWRSPVVVSSRSGFVVKGHGRLQAARLAGFTACPVEYQDYASEAEEIADMVADNRISELSDPDRDAMAETLQGVSVEMRGLLGFDPDPEPDPDPTPTEPPTEPAPPAQPALTGKLGKPLTFKMKSYSYTMTPEESEAIVAECEAYVKREGTLFGFVRFLLTKNETQ